MNLLLVEDVKEQAMIVEALLEENRRTSHNITHVENMKDAIKSAHKTYFDAALLDLNLPDSKGVDTVSLLHDIQPDLPIIVLTGVDNENIGINAVRHGAQDFLVKKNMTGQKILNAIDYAVERQKLQLALQNMAFHDSLTGLPNRNLFYNRLEQSISSSERSGKEFALHVLNIDGFKEINNTYGHDAGDIFLALISKRILDTIRAKDTLSRVGSDEFAILQTDISNAYEAAFLTKRVIQAMEEPFSLCGEDVKSSLTIGTAFFPAHGSTAEELLKKADKALYKGKESGKSVAKLFGDGVDEDLYEMLCK